LGAFKKKQKQEMVELRGQVATLRKRYERLRALSMPSLPVVEKEVADEAVMSRSLPELPRMVEVEEKPPPPLPRIVQFAFTLLLLYQSISTYAIFVYSRLKRER
jgi:hypothetical protein